MLNYKTVNLQPVDFLHGRPFALMLRIETYLAEFVLAGRLHSVFGHFVGSDAVRVAERSFDS